MTKDKEYHSRTILQVVPALVTGGVERGTLEIAKKIVDSGINSIVISAGGPLVAKLEQGGSKHITLNVASKNPFVIWRNAGKIANIIKNYNVDIVHARSRAPAWSCYLAAKSTGVKLITTFHGIYNFKNGIKKFYNSVMTKGERIIAVSNFVRDHIINNYAVNKEKVVVIHRGVNFKEFSKDKLSQEVLEKTREKYRAPKDMKVLLLPSRMTRWKGHLTLIDALAKIKEMDFYCIIAGDLSKHPNFVAEIQNKIQEYRIQNRVQLFGNDPKIINLYGIADVIISASVEPEAFGRTIIEAQSMEKLVIATNIGGACETIQDGTTGFHVKPGDSDDLANKISHCLNIIGTKEEEKITRMARKTVSENFSLDLMTSKTMDVYDEVLK